MQQIINSITLSNVSTEIINWIRDLFVSHLADLLITGVLFILLLLLSYILVTLFVVPRYKRKLYTNIFPDENPWLNDNKPDDIYVALQANFSDNNEQENDENQIEYDLSSLMSERLINSSEFYVVLGRAGEGKTLSLCKIAKDIIDGYKSVYENENEHKKDYKKLLPIFIKFSEISNIQEKSNIVDIIQSKIIETAFNKNSTKAFLIPIKKYVSRIINSYLKRGKFVFLIDGYDEIANDELRLKCSNVIIEFANQYRKNNYIISSRISVYEKEPFPTVSRINLLYLLPFNKEKIKEFISKYSFPNNKSGSELYQKIINTPQIETVVSNPLLLTMVTHLYSNSDFQFTNSKANLYKGCCDCLLDAWDENKSKKYRRYNKYSESLNLEEKNVLLAILANELYKNNSNPIKTSYLEKIWANDFFEESHHTISARKALDKIINGSGLLQRFNIGNQEYISFHHRSFYEYYVALYYLNNNIVFQPRSKNDNAIEFFFLSLSDDEKLIEDYSKNLYFDIKTLCDILIEKRVNNQQLIEETVDKFVMELDLNRLNDVLTLGYLASIYDFVKSRVAFYLRFKLVTNNKNKKLNILLCFMLFEDKETVCKLFSNEISEIELEDLVANSGEELDDYANIVFEMQNTKSEKLRFVEFLAKYYRFSSIYNIFKSCKDDNTKHISVIGLLYMSRNIDLFKWLNKNNLLNSATNDEVEQSKNLKKKYKWAGNELSDDEQNCLFYIVLLAKEIIKEHSDLNKSLISHRVLFLLSYIISDETSEIVNYTDLKGVKFESRFEFPNHWNRVRIYYNITPVSLSFGMNVVSLSRINAISIIIFALTQIVYYLYYCSSRLANAVSIHNTVNNARDYTFNSKYLGLVAVIILCILLVNLLLRKGHHTIISLIMNVLMVAGFIIVYNNTVELLILRLSFYVLMGVIFISETIKHRVNYPSLKNPYFTRVQNYLIDDNDD